MVKTLWKQSRLVRLGVMIAVVFAVGAPVRLAASQMTTVHVQVNDAKTGDPIYQARLTLRYRVPGRFMRRTKIISYTAKTDKDGKHDKNIHHHAGQSSDAELAAKVGKAALLIGGVLHVLLVALP